MKPVSGEPAFDFATLASADASQPGRNLRAQLWLLGFLALLVASVVALGLYLQNFESEEEARQNMADAQWLEQSIAFHFRRLEDDLRSQARRLRDTEDRSATPQQIHGGLLWSEPDVILARGWLDAQGPQVLLGDLARLATDGLAHPENAAALAAKSAVTIPLVRGVLQT